MSVKSFLLTVSFSLSKSAVVTPSTFEITSILTGMNSFANLIYLAIKLLRKPKIVKWSKDTLSWQLTFLALGWTHRVTNKIFVSLRQTGGNEPPSVGGGHLGGGEPIVKPAWKVGFLFWKEWADHFGWRRRYARG